MKPGRGTRSALIALVVVILAGAAFVGVRALWDAASRHFASDSCTVGGFDLDPGQAAVASTMVGAVTKYRVRLPERASVLVLAAALQESKLTNLAPGEGDRDSVGVLQQRPSQGWGGGKSEPLQDVGEATTEFLTALVKVPNWQTVALAKAVQAVQISADGSAYAQHEGEAKALADALQGTKQAAVACSFGKPTRVVTVADVAAQVRAQLGIDTPVAVGNTVRVPGAGWQTAAWFVANAHRLGIQQVDYAGQRWVRNNDWKKQSSAGSSAVIATMSGR